jgi:hypothetical protein
MRHTVTAVAVVIAITITCGAEQSALANPDAKESTDSQQDFDARAQELQEELDRLRANLERRRQEQALREMDLLTRAIILPDGRAVGVGADGRYYDRAGNALSGPDHEEARKRHRELGWYARSIDDWPTLSHNDRGTVRSTSGMLTLADWRHLSAPDKASRAWQQVLDLVTYYRGIHGADGNLKSSEDMARHVLASRFIEELFVLFDPEAGTRRLMEGRLAALTDAIDELSVAQGDQTLQDAVLLFVRSQYQRQHGS